MIEKYDLLQVILSGSFWSFPLCFLVFFFVFCFFFQNLQVLILTRGKRGGIPWVKKATS